MLKFFSSKKVQIAIIVVLTAFAYSNIFANDFAIDDGDFIYNWPLIKKVGEVGEVGKVRGVGERIGRIFTVESVPEDHAGVYRPVKALAMMVWLNIFGVRVFWYHLFSLAVHLINTVLVWAIVREIGGVRGIRGIGGRKWVPFVAGLLFGLHPIHTEAVTFVLASFDTLGITFYLAAFWLYVKSVHGSRFTVHGYVGSVGLAVLGFFTYELTLTLPILILLYEWTIGKNFQFSIFNFQFWKLKVFVPYFAGAAFYIIIRFFVLDLGARGEYLGGSFFKTALVEIRAFTKYIELLIWPVNLSIDHEILPGIFSVVYKDLVRVETLENLLNLPAIFISFGLLTGLAVLMIVCRRRIPLISFAIGWFFITLLPVAFIFPQSSIMAERYVYVPSFGFILGTVVFINLVFNNMGSLLTQKSKFKSQNYNSKLKTFKFLPALLIFYFCLFTFYGIRTYLRNFDWKDTLTVWEKLTRQAPDNPVANYTLGKIYAERGDKDLAIAYFSQALAIHPNIAEVNFRLGRIYQERGELDKARLYFEVAAQENNPRYFFMASKEIKKIEYLKKFKISNLKFQIDKWGKYTLEDRVNLEYPESWMVTEFNKGVSFDALDESFSVEIVIDEKEAGESFESYLLRAPDHFGKLVGEGAAQVPNVNGAYVKVWKDDEVDKLEFFLSQDDVVVKILVYSANSPKMADFDKLLGSIKIG